MKISNKNLKRIGMLLFLVVLAGCAVARTESGAIESPITLSTPWEWSAGWFDFLFVIPIAKLILWVGEQSNYALGIVAGTVAVSLVTLPIMIKSTISSQKMTLIQPEIKKIQDKYSGRKDQASQTRMSMELQQLYKDNNVSLGLSMIVPFLSFPIMIAMWHAIQRIEAVFAGSGFLGMSLSAIPAEAIKDFGVKYIILVLLVGVTQFISVEITNILGRKYNPDFKAPQGMMKNMNYIMLAMIVMMAFTMQTAMSIYWVTTSVFGFVRTVFIQYKFIIPSYGKKKPTSYLDKKGK